MRAYHVNDDEIWFVNTMRLLTSAQQHVVRVVVSKMASGQGSIRLLGGNVIALAPQGRAAKPIQ